MYQPFVKVLYQFIFILIPSSNYKIKVYNIYNVICNTSAFSSLFEFAISQ